MFETRLRLILIFFATCWAIVVVRLFQLQVVQADDYREQAECLLTRSSKYLEAIRGRILDRNGLVLASHEPAWAIAMHYRLLVRDPDYLTALAAKSLRLRGKKKPSAAEIEESKLRLQEQISDLWATLADFSSEPIEALHERAEEIKSRVARWKDSYQRRNGIRDDIAEENACHPIVLDLDNRQHILAENLLMKRFADLVRCGAVQVTDSGKRRYPGGECMAHVLGTVGKVSAADVAARPFREGGEVLHWDGYAATDAAGVSGVERLGEMTLRGRRGRVLEYRDNRESDRIDPQHGKDLRLTIDYELQSMIFDMLRRRIDHDAVIPGGSVVVLDVSGGDVLAMVSYPAFDPNRYRENYSELISDTKHFPLHFRAIYSRYAPGSIIKPLTVVAAHSLKVIDEKSTHRCEGYYDPGNHHSQRCWVPSGSHGPISHGTINSELAIKHSCNVFCYHLGSDLGVDRLCNWLKMFGVGQKTGIGLAEEKFGILPTSSYLESVKNRPVRIGDARNYAIGQGEILITPLQAANIVATYARGSYKPVRLIAGGEDTPSWELPVEDAVWQLIRRGMYRVVNESGGTATLHAKLVHPEFVLCGKSGSAETPRWRTRFRVDFEDDGQSFAVEVSAGSEGTAKKEFARLHPQFQDCKLEIRAIEYWPNFVDANRKHSHAWFIAFIQKKGPNGSPDWRVQRRVAIAVLLEFGGSGGQASGPLCRDVAELIIDHFPQYVESPRMLSEAGQ